MRLLKLGFVIALASGLAAILIYITGVSNSDWSFHISNEDLEALRSLQSHFQQCVSANGLGLQAVSGKDYCKITMKFPRETVPKWRDPKTGELEGLSFDFNICEAVATWEQRGTCSGAEYYDDTNAGVHRCFAKWMGGICMAEDQQGIASEPV